MQCGPCHHKGLLRARGQSVARHQCGPDAEDVARGLPGHPLELEAALKDGCGT